MEMVLSMLKVNICWIAFYGCYWVLFRKYTFFALNRYYLLFSLLAGLIIPAIHIPTALEVIESPIYHVDVAGTEAIIATKKTEYSIKRILLYCYVAGVLVMLVVLLRDIYNIILRIRSGTIIATQDHWLVISQQNDTCGGSFSFLKWVVITQSDYATNFEPVYMHECVHVRQLHTIDILFVELLKVFFWFNPTLWLYKNALQTTHEYLADEQARDRDLYAAFLLSCARISIGSVLANPFFNPSILQKRIYMIYKRRTATWLKGKYLLFLPILLTALICMATRTYVDTISDDDKAADKNFKTPSHYQTREPNRDKQIVNNHPSYLGLGKARKKTLAAGDTMYSRQFDHGPWLKDKDKFIAKNLSYPDQALQDSIEGQVLVSFLIDANGDVSDPKIVQGLREDVNNEALRVVQLMPRWTPAQKDNEAIPVRYTMNFTFNIAVNALPVSVKEKTPDFWSNKSLYSPTQTKPVSNKHLRAFFDRSLPDLSRPTASSMSTQRYSIRYASSPSRNTANLNIELPKK